MRSRLLPKISLSLQLPIFHFFSILFKLYPQQQQYSNAVYFVQGFHPSTESWSLIHKRFYHHHYHYHHHASNKQQTWSKNILPKCRSKQCHFISRLNSHNQNNEDNNYGNFLILWRGEKDKGYSEQLRHLEFCNAMSVISKIMKPYDKQDSHTEQKTTETEYPLVFDNALCYNNCLENHISTRSTKENSKGNNSSPKFNVEKQEFDAAMQYVQIDYTSTMISTNHEPNADGLLTPQLIKATTERCSLVRATYQILATGTTYHELAQNALKNNNLMEYSNHNHGDTGKDPKDSTSSFALSPSLMKAIEGNSTWCVRLRDYTGQRDETDTPHNLSSTSASTSASASAKPPSRYGANMKSPLRRERQAILEMKDFVLQFQGKVDLINPELKLYIMEGLLPPRPQQQQQQQQQQHGGKSRTNNDESKYDNAGNNHQKILAIQIAEGPKISMYAPNTRICITNTPLDPVAAFSMCNIAQISHDSNVLDPFCGSCSTLLAATHIAGISPINNQMGNIVNGCKTVGIELAHGGYVNFENVEQDFLTRNLKAPAALIRGDCRDFRIREKARAAIGGEPFDAIVTDPPYGIRESLDLELEYGDYPPLTELVEAMANDIKKGKPLLKSGGRMIVFVPVMEGENLSSKLPNEDLLRKAGLKVTAAKEQFLSRILSRWMVVFINKY